MIAAAEENNLDLLTPWKYSGSTYLRIHLILYSYFISTGSRMGHILKLDYLLPLASRITDV